VVGSIGSSIGGTIVSGVLRWRSGGVGGGIGGWGHHHDRRWCEDHCGLKEDGESCDRHAYKEFGGHRRRRVGHGGGSQRGERCDVIL
jgi:hypothetical protein